ncbi:MAG: 50S ribosomal protein L3, partial [Pseudomonadota bacterium]|nr:50S ribosomal protein L3 [Pseudomonadota bacterium]
GLIMVRGAVPGSRGGFVMIKDAIKTTVPEDVPYPAAFKAPEASEVATEAPVAAEASVATESEE